VVHGALGTLAGETLGALAAHDGLVLGFGVVEKFGGEFYAALLVKAMRRWLVW
jgi:hypothetical protein